MLFNVNDEDKNKSGVYKIYNLKNGRMYYGSTHLFTERYEAHIKYLKANNHTNKFLQRDFKKCGTKAFVFEILKLTSIEKRLFEEQNYLDVYYDKQNKCYNFKKHVIQAERSCYSYTPEESSKRLSKSQKSAWENDFERKKKQSERSLSNVDKFLENCSTKQAKEKRTAKLAKTYLFINPAGDITTIVNLRNFCRENNLNNQNMTKVFCGKAPSYKGWRQYNINIAGKPYISNVNHNQKSFKIKNPLGEIFEMTNIRQFSIINNLKEKSLASVIRGDRNSHKGWTRAD